MKRKRKLIDTWVKIEGRKFDAQWVPVGDGKAQCLWVGSSVYVIEPNEGKKGYNMILYVKGEPIKYWEYAKRNQAFFHGTLLFGLRMHHREKALLN